MRRIVPTMMVAVMLFLAGGAARVYGQEACSFVGGFAELSALVGEQKVGTCLENEQFNTDNGNAEQRTTGGLLVWRKADNFTAFTDGGTTWINGPNGLQSRANGERLSWERDPVAATGAPASPTPRPLPTLPVTTPLTPEPVTAPRVLTNGGTLASTNNTAQAGPVAQAGVANLPPPTVASGPLSAGAATPVPGGTPTGIGAAASSAGASTVPPPPPPAPNASTVPPPPPPAPNAAAAPAATATPTPTKTPTSRPAVTAKFTERPDEVDTGNDAQFEVETNARKGSCSLTVAYRSTAEVSMGAKTIDDGRCEWKFTLPADAKTGKAKAVVVVAATEGTTTIEDTFEVKKGDTAYAGSVDLEVDPTDMPDKNVEPGGEIKVGVDTNLKRKGSCALTLTWPKVGPVAAESQMPDDGGRCSWKVKVPVDAPRNSSASLTVTVHKDSSTYRTLTKEFKVAR